jgi:excisionase family DNA binding protein
MESDRVGMVVEEALLALAEVASHLRVSKVTVMRWVRAGQLPAAKFGKTWLVSETRLDAWVKAKAQPPQTIAALDWTRRQAHETRQRLGAFEEDWSAPGMEAYDEL